MGSSFPFTSGGIDATRGHPSDIPAPRWDAPGSSIHFGSLEFISNQLGNIDIREWAPTPGETQAPEGPIAPKGFPELAKEVMRAKGHLRSDPLFDFIGEDSLGSERDAIPAAGANQCARGRTVRN